MIGWLVRKRWMDDNARGVEESSQVGKVGTRAVLIVWESTLLDASTFYSLPGSRVAANGSRPYDDIM